VPREENEAERDGKDWWHFFCVITANTYRNPEIKQCEIRFGLNKARTHGKPLSNLGAYALGTRKNISKCHKKSEQKFDSYM
jgi:hypothetical protein